MNFSLPVADADTVDLTEFVVDFVAVTNEIKGFLSKIVEKTKLRRVFI